MNIFETYLDKIIKLIKSAKEDNLLELPENLSGAATTAQISMPLFIRYLRQSLAKSGVP